MDMRCINTDISVQIEAERCVTRLYRYRWIRTREYFYVKIIICRDMELDRRAQR